MILTIPAVELASNHGDRAWPHRPDVALVYWRPRAAGREDPAPSRKPTREVTTAVPIEADALFVPFSPGV